MVSRDDYGFDIPRLAPSQSPLLLSCWSQHEAYMEYLRFDSPHPQDREDSTLRVDPITGVESYDIVAIYDARGTISGLGMAATSTFEYLCWRAGFPFDATFSSPCWRKDTSLTARDMPLVRQFWLTHEIEDTQVTEVTHATPVPAPDYDWTDDEEPPEFMVEDAGHTPFHSVPQTPPLSTPPSSPIFSLNSEYFGPSCIISSPSYSPSSPSYAPTPMLSDESDDDSIYQIPDLTLPPLASLSSEDASLSEYGTASIEY